MVERKIFFILILVSAFENENKFQVDIDKSHFNSTVVIFLH